MIIHGSPLTSIRPDPHDDGARFWYWFGASGRRYITSVYAAARCPPLPGAVFIAVKRTGALRTALSVGRFGAFWELGYNPANDPNLEADELHVHLLARDDDDARNIAADLVQALTAMPDRRSEPAPIRWPAVQAADRGYQARADAQPC